MKVTIKTGAVKFNATQSPSKESREGVVQCTGSEKNVEFSLEPCEYTFDCEPGELAEIYREVLPAIKDIAKMFAMK